MLQHKSGKNEECVFLLAVQSLSDKKMLLRLGSPQNKRVEPWGPRWIPGWTVGVQWKEQWFETGSLNELTLGTLLSPWALFSSPYKKDMGDQKFSRPLIWHSIEVVTVGFWTECSFGFLLSWGKGQWKKITLWNGRREPSPSPHCLSISQLLCCSISYTPGSIML